jgi:hypothetical protein
VRKQNPKSNVSRNVFATLVGQVAQSPKPQLDQFVVEGVELAQGWNVGNRVTAQHDIALKGALGRNEFGYLTGSTGRFNSQVANPLT